MRSGMANVLSSTTASQSMESSSKRIQLSATGAARR